MVSIIKMENCNNWPLIIRCNGKINETTTCPATFKVSMPGDMTRVRHEGTPTQFDAAIECPVCGKMHFIDSESIPAEIFNKIPHESAGLMQYHD